MQSHLVLMEKEITFTNHTWKSQYTNAFSSLSIIITAGTLLVNQLPRNNTVTRKKSHIKFKIHKLVVEKKNTQNQSADTCTQ